MLSIDTKTKIAKEIAIKYFLIQITASRILIIRFLYKENNIIRKITLLISSSLITLSLVIKVAAAPLHTWLIPISNKIRWNRLALLLTWQKIGPLLILLKNNYWKPILIIRLTSILIGTLSQFNMTKTKLIITLSSVTHFGWIIISIISNKTIPLVYLLIYRIISITIIINFKKKT